MAEVEKWQNFATKMGLDFGVEMVFFIFCCKSTEATKCFELLTLCVLDRGSECLGFKKKPHCHFSNVRSHKISKPPPPFFPDRI